MLPKERVKMTPLERAKQFAPFAALRGHENELERAARQLPQKRELTEDEARVLDRRLRSWNKGDWVLAVRFTGEGYQRTEGSFRFLDSAAGYLYIAEQKIPLGCLVYAERLSGDPDKEKRSSG